MVTDNPVPWEQQLGEKALWFGRFHDFLMAGPDRTLLGVYNAWKVSKGKKKSRSPAKTWRDACERWKWRERAEAYDAMLRATERSLAEEGWKEAATILGSSAPDAARALKAVMEQKHVGQRRLAADSILDRAKETATKQVMEISDETKLVLRRIGALAIRYVKPEDRDAFEKDFEELMEEK